MSQWWRFGFGQESNSIFRSEKMSLVQMFLQPEAAYDTISRLGELGCVQFRDINESVPTQQKKFITEVRRCDELERKIRYVIAELEKDGHEVLPLTEDFPPAPKPRDIIELETHMEKTETEIMELASNNINLQTSYLELTEMIQVLERTEEFFSDQESHNFDLNKRGTHRDPEQANGQLGFVAGVINREREYGFERMLWRISRGNVLVRRAEVDVPLTDPRTGSVLHKSVFVVFFQGDQLQARIRKVCQGFHAHMYPCPSSHEERMEMVKSVRTRLDDLKAIMEKTKEHRTSVLTPLAQQLPKWSAMVKKMKAIYHTLNLFNMDLGSKCLIGEAWVPKRELELVETALAEGSDSVGSTVPSFFNLVDTQKEPPTYFRTNKFTRGFQNLIDAYGICNYREVNPGLYTCITFPFLFAVMFGDMGHGFILMLIGLWMVADEKRLGKHRWGEIWTIFFAGRYIILLMGLFAIYTGFHYNDLFSKSINVFGSHWVNVYNESTIFANPALQLNPSVATRGVYPMGIDPVWQSAGNKIIFMNTYKMKMSIIFGVLHMVFGICLSVENFVHFKSYADIFLQFVPQVLFLLLMFGYMVFMMFYKWVKYSATSDVEANTPGCAPSVLIMFINMVMFGKEVALPGCEVGMFACQKPLEMTFLGLALLCIPWILLGKPLYIKYKRRNKLEVSQSEESVDHSEEEKEEEPMSEIWIHQAIHTIEYILSTISHTASYLRLWALSLAHSQLSLVLWGMVFTKILTIPAGYLSSIMIFLVFAIWAFFTISIMVVMEGLSAFLHTLRLHWVEFMSKFYAGTGSQFTPFSFQDLLKPTDYDE